MAEIKAKICPECGKRPLPPPNPYLGAQERCDPCDLEHRKQVSSANRGMRHGN
jgi:uncharacterized protein (DUF983 family)